MELTVGKKTNRNKTWEEEGRRKPTRTNYVCVLLMVTIAVIKHQDRDNLQKSEFIWVYRSRELESMRVEQKQ